MPTSTTRHILQLQVPQHRLMHRLGHRRSPGIVQMCVRPARRRIRPERVDIHHATSADRGRWRAISSRCMWPVPQQPPQMSTKPREVQFAILGLSTAEPTAMGALAFETGTTYRVEPTLEADLGLVDARTPEGVIGTHLELGPEVDFYVAPSETDLVGLDENDDMAPLYEDARLGPWDGRWVVDSYVLDDGTEVVSRFCSDEVDDICVGVQKFFPVAFYHQEGLPICPSGQVCASSYIRKKSRRGGSCSPHHLERVCSSRDRAAYAEADADCGGGGEECLCSGSYQLPVERMSQKYRYCTYRCYGRYAGTCQATE